METYLRRSSTSTLKWDLSLISSNRESGTALPWAAHLTASCLSCGVAHPQHAHDAHLQANPWRFGHRTPTESYTEVDWEVTNLGFIQGMNEEGLGTVNWWRRRRRWGSPASVAAQGRWWRIDAFVVAVFKRGANDIWLLCWLGRKVALYEKVITSLSFVNLRCYSELCI